ncbi:hypothetical protein D3C87_865150 [compost metagenome]
MPNFVLDLEVDRVDLVDEGDNSEAYIRLYKRKEPNITMNYDEILAKMDKADADVIRSEMSKAKAEVPAETAEELEKVKQEKADADGKYQAAFDEGEVMKSKIKKLEGAAEEPDFEEVLKSMDPSIQKMMRSMNDQRIAAEAVAKQLSEKAILDEAVAKAATLKSIPVEEAELVEVVKSASPGLMAVLTAANNAIEESLSFTEVGKGKADTANNNKDSDAAWAKIEKRADELVLEKKVTREKAVSMVISEQPELYKEYMKGGAN